MSIKISFNKNLSDKSVKNYVFFCDHSFKIYGLNKLQISDQSSLINKTINSKDIFLNDKFYLLNIWASWCVPCREEHKFLMNLHKEKLIDIIGLNYKDNHLKAKKFLDDLKSPYKIILKDLDGTIAIEWGAYGVPETFLIYDKKIVKKIIGPLNENSILEIKEIIK